MSYIEYEDMFIKCQKYAPYQLFVWDMKNSRNCIDKDRNAKLKLLIDLVYLEIKNIEKKSNTKILHDPVKERLDLENPFCLFDTIGFSINRDTMDNDEVDFLFNYIKDKLNINYEFHSSNGYYETDDYNLGNKLYFRGYCIANLANKHKEKEVHYEGSIRSFK